MVNTRRSESSSVAPEIGQRYQTRNAANRELDSSCDSAEDFEQEEEEEEEDSTQEADDSLSSQEKRMNERHGSDSRPLVSRVRELRNRLVSAQINAQTRLHIRQLRNFKDCRKLTVYSPHKMRNIMDSDLDDCYSPRRISKKNRFTKITADIERRAALSLRPIMQKSYKDCENSAPNCNSEDSAESIAVRRSLRNRNRRYANRSWIDDDQMHKIGYPNPHRYSDDRMDPENQHSTRESTRRATRHSYDDRSGDKYMYDGYHQENQPKADQNNESDAVSDESGSQNKENKVDVANRNNGRCLRSVTKPSAKESESKESDTQNEEIIKKEEETQSNTPNDEDKASAASPSTTENNHEDNDNDGNGGDSNEAQEDEEETPIPKRNQNMKPRKRQLSSSTSSEVKVYSLRHRAPRNCSNNPLPSSMNNRYILRNNRERANSRRNNVRRQQNSDSSSDSSDSDSRGDRRATVVKFPKNFKSPHSKNEQLKSGAGQVLPISPESIDPKITFKSVGGLAGHVHCLKEMILMPMMYPEVFERFQIQPPKGVLFYGPPGTGKTLLARALANECSIGSKKVSFYMRKGADLLSKWIGESEKQLRILFEQAAEKKPAIIFFDELDGLAPVRSSKQDQIHASIVSTLLALMDGLDNRGDVIVIGATNRIDAIDPALRRPGRFDRELFFPLPAQKEREEILNVHVSQWKSPPSAQLISYLADGAVGYCGSDLRALCSEAVIQSFRRTYPQVYATDHKLLLNPENVKVEKIDFLRAKSQLVPASHRVNESLGHKLNPLVKVLLEKPLKEVLHMLTKTFPHGTNPHLAKVKLSANVRPAHLLLSAENADYGHTTYLAPALLHHMEHIHYYVFDLASLFREAGRTPEEACVQIFHEAKRNVPSIIYIPNVETLWKLASETVTAIFMTQVHQIAPNSPILLLATSNVLYDDLPESLKNLYSLYRNEVYEMPLPDEESRVHFWKPLILETCLKAPRPERDQNKSLEMLPRAPTPEALPLNHEDMQGVYEQEEMTLRELRIFLRDMCKKLASNRLFFLFTKPVNVEEVPDYPDVIKEPMDLETMMTKVDFHRYECARDFLEDIELICRNALEYNPAKSSADKQIRHRACSLRDYAYALIKSQMDSDFEDKCRQISTRRRQRKACVTKYLPQYLCTTQEDGSLLSLPDAEKQDENKEAPKEKPIVSNGVTTSISMSVRPSPMKKRKTSSWQHGNLKKKRKRSNKPIIDAQKTDQSSIDKAAESLNKASTDEDSKENKLNGDEENLSTSDDKKSSSSGQNQEVINEKSKPEEEMRKEDSNKQSVKCDLNDLLSPSELLDDPLVIDDIDQVLNETVNESSNVKPSVSLEALEQILEAAVLITEDLPLLNLLDLYFQMSRIVKKYSNTLERIMLPNELAKELKRFKESYKSINDTAESMEDSNCQ